MDFNKEDTHKPTKKLRFKTKLYHEILSCDSDIFLFLKLKVYFLYSYSDQHTLLLGTVNQVKENQYTIYVTITHKMANTIF